MAGDLDGQDAFDKLMEVALESRVDVRRAQDQRDEAQQATRDMGQKVTQLQREVASLQDDLRRKAAGQEPALKELWEAAEALCQQIGPGGINSAEVVSGNTPAVIRLRSALQVAAIYCDQIPF